MYFRVKELLTDVSGMMEAARTSETSVNNYFTRQYIPETTLNFKKAVICIIASLRTRNLTRTFRLFTFGINKMDKRTREVEGILDAFNRESEILCGNG
jgi:hypothetical protein